MDTNLHSTDEVTLQSSKKSSHKKKSKTQNRSNSVSDSFNQSLSSVSIDPDIDCELITLHNKYRQSKDNRKKTEMDYNSMKNKLKMLQMEEEKIKNKEKVLYMKTEQRDRMIMNNVNQKKLLTESKIKIEEKIRELKMQNSFMKSERDVTLRKWRRRKVEGQNDLIQKIKEQRKIDMQRIMLKRQKELEDKKEKVQKAKSQRYHSAENRKVGEYYKKIQLKKELLQKILDEEAKQQNYEQGVNHYQTKTEEIINRIKAITEKLKKNNNE